jgi:hypothetical protein
MRSACPALAPVCRTAAPGGHSLKRDQGIKIDFLSFPRDLATLLDRCAAADEGR